MSKPLSIFNEILGPVMRGPSSSHTAAAYRIGLLSMQIFGRKLKKMIVEFSTKGSLPTTYKSQGSEVGLLSGLMGIPMESEKVMNVVSLFHEAGLETEIVVNDDPCDHPNIYNLTLVDPDGYSMKLTGVSTGGGMIRITRINDKKVNIEGDQIEYIEGIGEIHPILPIPYSEKATLPFTNAAEFEKQLKEDTPIWKQALEYEALRGGISQEEVRKVASSILSVMRSSLNTGLSGTDYKDRILGQQFHLIDQGVKKNKLIPSALINRIAKYVLAIMECKSSFGVIVAAPTAGSCAVVPATILACGDEYGFTEEEMTQALLASGLIGLFIAKDATLSAEVGGCQAECGAASGMAAAAVVQLMGGTVREALQASSFALQNILGMICDPIANRVEAPCLGKNIMCSVNAVSAANISLAGVDTLIPLSEVIQTMDKVGKSICHELRCTSLGGLSVCKTSLEIMKKLEHEAD